MRVDIPNVESTRTTFALVGRAEPGAAPLENVLLESKLVRDSRSRAEGSLEKPERLVTVALGTSFAVVASAMALLTDGSGSASFGLIALFVALYAALSRVKFEVGPGAAVPTQLVLVPMLFVLPPAIVPCCVGLALAFSGLFDYLRRRSYLDRSFVLLASSWQSVGPALVLALFAPGPPHWSRWPIYVAALAAQFAFDAASTILRNWLGLGISPRVLLDSMAWVFVVDASLAPVGLLAAFASVEQELAFLLVVPLAALLGAVARDRKEQLDQSLALTQAYEDANQEARSDALTKLGNRLAWEEALAAIDARNEEPVPVSVVLLDLNGLKLANDTRGHEFGDRLLRSVASLLGGAAPEASLTARVGGDEFALLFDHTGEPACREIVARIRRTILRRPDIDGFPFSVSIGWSSCPPAETLAQAIALADGELYAEKSRSPITRIVKAS